MWTQGENFHISVTVVNGSHREISELVPLKLQNCNSAVVASCSNKFAMCLKNQLRHLMPKWSPPHLCYCHVLKISEQLFSRFSLVNSFCKKWFTDLLMDISFFYIWEYSWSVKLLFVQAKLKKDTTTDFFFSEEYCETFYESSFRDHLWKVVSH